MGPKIGRKGRGGPHEIVVVEQPPDVAMLEQSKPIDLERDVENALFSISARRLEDQALVERSVGEVSVVSGPPDALASPDVRRRWLEPRGQAPLDQSLEGREGRSPVSGAEQRQP